MGFKVFKKNTVPTDVYLKLFEEIVSGEVTVAIVDAHGVRIGGGSIITFAEGGIRRHTNIHKKFGLDVDEYGKIADVILPHQMHD